MKIYLYIDESGSIHKNSKTQYFAVGGYFVLQEDKNKVVSTYKRENLLIKRKRGIDLSKEIKSFDYENEEKVEIFNLIQDIDTFVGCVKIFDKSKMHKQIDDSNIFYNYAVYVLLKDCVLPFINQNYEDENFEFIISADSRNTSVGDKKDLEKYLKTVFVLKNYQFKITYYDSATNYGIQLADLVVNTFYNKHKDINIVKDVVSSIKEKNFIIKRFPGNY
jgi:hypothetical protein